MEESKIKFFSPDNIVREMRNRKLLGEDIYDVIVGEIMGSNPVTRIAFKNYILSKFSSIARKDLWTAREMATTTLLRLIAESAFPQVRNSRKNFEVSMFAALDRRMMLKLTSSKQKLYFKMFLEIEKIDKIDTHSQYSILAVTLPGFLTSLEFSDVYWAANIPLFMTLRKNGKILERTVNMEYVTLTPDYIPGETEKNLENIVPRDDDKEFAFQLIYFFQMPQSFRAFEMKGKDIEFNLGDFQEKYESLAHS